MKSERGNIVVYLLVGLVLFGVLLGGVWWVKNRVANKPTPVGTTQEEKTVQPGTDTQVDQDKAPETKPEETKPAETKPEEQAPSTSSVPATPAPETNNAGGISSSASSTPTTNGAATNRGTDLAALPPESRMASTGPSPTNVAASGPLENALGTSLGLGIVTFLGSSYVLSRKRAH